MIRIFKQYVPPQDKYISSLAKELTNDIRGSDHKIDCFDQMSKLIVNLYHNKEININQFSKQLSNA